MQASRVTLSLVRPLNPAFDKAISKTLRAVWIATDMMFNEMLIESHKLDVYLHDLTPRNFKVTDAAQGGERRNWILMFFRLHTCSSRAITAKMIAL